MFKPDPGQDASPLFMEAVPERYKDYLVGRQQWGWRPRYRSLKEPAQEIYY
jgi:hypothetical protein